MTNPIRDHMLNWEAKAIEQCRNDPAFPKNICPVCVIELPDCLCVRRAIKDDLRYANKPKPKSWWRWWV